MIIKSLPGRKNRKYYQILAYGYKGSSSKEFITHNIVDLNPSVLSITKKFKNQELYQRSHRNNVVRFYHEVIALNGDDPIQEHHLQEVAAKYLELRLGDRGIGVGFTHIDHTNPHCHIIFHAGGFDGKQIRISRSQFRSLKRDLHDWIRFRFPELEKSAIDLSLEKEKRQYSKQFSKKRIFENEITLKQKKEKLKTMKLNKILEQGGRRL